MKSPDFFEELRNKVEEFTYHNNILTYNYFSSLTSITARSLNVDKLSAFDIFIIEFLYQKPLSISQIAQKLFIKFPLLSRMVKNLETLGFIERFYKPDDRRTTFLKLKPFAREKLKNVIAVSLLAIKKEMVRRFTNDEIIKASNILLSIVILYEKIKILSTGEEFISDGMLYEEFFKNLRRHSCYKNYFFTYPQYEKPELITKAKLSYDNHRAVTLLYNEFFSANKKPVALSTFASIINADAFRPEKVSRIVTKLEKSSFLRRVKISGDYRLVYLVPTENGLAAADEADKSHKEYITKTLSDSLSDQELEKLMHSYNILLDMFNN